MIQNEYCPSCMKINVCEWYTKLSKLEGTEKKPIGLNITVNDCEEYVLDPDVEESDEE